VTVIHGGSQYAPSDLIKEVERNIQIPIPRIPLHDSRAHQLFVFRSGYGRYYAVPAPDYFSRYSGTCLMLGDKHHESIEYSLQVGDMLHLGSVGLVVTELDSGAPGDHRVISTAETKFLLDSSVKIFSQDSDFITDTATLLPQETSECPPQCYMCFESDSGPENPLINACQCRGDTAIVHLECVRRWNSASNEEKACIATNPLRKSNPLCRVCKTTYKSFIIFSDGKREPLFHQQAKAPYISFVVVTKHDTASELFNTKYQLSFHNVLQQNQTPQLYIGRSTECDLILDYRTISGWHGVIKFQNQQFIYQDLRSSNGTLVYIRQPVELPYDTPRTFRLGRTLVSLLHKSTSSKKDKSSHAMEEEKFEIQDPDLESLTNLCKWPSEASSKDEDMYTQNINKLNDNLSKSKEDVSQIDNQPDIEIVLENPSDNYPVMNENNEVSIAFDEFALSDEPEEKN